MEMHMKPLSLSFVLAAVVVSGARAQSAPTTLKDSIVAIEKQSWDAWTKRDGEFFARFLSDDHVEVGASGVAAKPAVVAFVGSPVCVVKSYDGTNFHFTQFDANTVVLVYRVEQNTTCGGTPVPSPAWTTSLYVKRAGRWVNALYQQTPVAGR
jgi:hypothetical protein